ncbi:MAG: hypothetical protein DRI34_14270 [Deltaproteobacteria bacterium]|nr:MAG: hypothetical protein DRI34_14270 [Deltaproteobacteria bacterium]
MSAVKLHIVVAGVLVLCAGCAHRPAPQAQPTPYARPDLEFAGIKFTNRSFHGMETTWRFTLTSRDERPAPLAGCQWRLDLEGREPVEQAAEAPAELPGRDSRQIVVHYALPWPEQAQEIVTFLGRERIPYSLKLTCRIAGPGEPLVVSAGDSGSLPLPRLPTMKVTGANAERFSGQEFRLNFEITLTNENTFKVKVRQIVYRITAEGHLLSEGRLPVEEDIPGNSETSYEISSGMLSAREDPSVGPLLAKPQVSYRLEGEVEFGAFRIPVADEGTVNFPR